jgi:hypothetical protein
MSSQLLRAPLAPVFVFCADEQEPKFFFIVIEEASTHHSSAATAIPVYVLEPVKCPGHLR